MTHANDCTRPTSIFFEVRGGWIWMACRTCGATEVRRPAKKAAA